jgi:hypothetical protein
MGRRAARLVAVWALVACFERFTAVHVKDFPKVEICSKPLLCLGFPTELPTRDVRYPIEKLRGPGGVYLRLADLPSLEARCRCFAPVRFAHIGQRGRIEARESRSRICHVSTTFSRARDSRLSGWGRSGNVPGRTISTRARSPCTSPTLVKITLSGRMWPR